MGLLHDLIWKYGTEESGGGGDFKKATLSIINNSNVNMAVFVPYILEYDGAIYMTPVVHASNNTETDVEIILPNVGACAGGLYKEMLGDYSCDLTGVTITTAGDIEYEDNEIMITGDCSITIA